MNQRARKENLSSVPLITVGITCYNAAQTIERAVSSARSQDWPNLEIVFVDDASSDNSLDMVRGLASSDPRIAVFCHPCNKGCAAARNTILKNARGEFIVFFDDDDFSESGRVRSQYERITNYELRTGAELVLCYASGVRKYPNGYEVDLRAIGSREKIPIDNIVIDYLLSFDKVSDVFYGAGTPTCALAARASVFSKVGGFDVTLKRMEDVDFAVRAAHMGGHFIGTEDRTLVQFATGGSDKTAEIEHRSFVCLLNKNRDYLEARGRYRYCLAWAKLRFHHFSGHHFKACMSLLVLVVCYPLRASRHFLKSATARYVHEQKMRASV